MRSKMETHADEAEKRVRDIRRATRFGDTLRKIAAKPAAPASPDSSWHTTPALPRHCKPQSVLWSEPSGWDRRPRAAAKFVSDRLDENQLKRGCPRAVWS